MRTSTASWGDALSSSTASQPIRSIGRRLQRPIALTLATLLLGAGFSATWANAAHAGPADPITINDANLRAVMNAQIPGHSATDAITEAEAAAINVIFGGGQGIQDLTGAEYLTGATALFLDDNQIADLSPLSGLTSLQALTLGTNLIEDLTPLSGLSGLVTLYLYENQVSDLTPLSGLTGLNSLDLETNLIENLSPLSTLTNVFDLEISENPISSLNPLVSLTGLGILWANNNGLVDITPLGSIGTLRELSLEYNSVESVAALAPLTNLDVLYLDGNRITNITPIAALLPNIESFSAVGQIWQMPEATIGATVTSPVFSNGLALPLTPDATTTGFAQGAPYTSWQFTTAGDKTLTWDVAVQIDAELPARFAGTILQEVSALPPTGSTLDSALAMSLFALILIMAGGALALSRRSSRTGG